MQQHERFLLFSLLIYIMVISLLADPVQASVTPNLRWDIVLANSETPQAKIMLPVSLELAILAADGTYRASNTLTLTDFTTMIPSSIEGEDQQIRYRIQLAGHSFEGEGIAFQGNTLYLKKIWLNTPGHLWYNILGEEFVENKQLTFHNVQITPDGQIKGAYLDQRTQCALHSYWVLTLSEFCFDERGMSARGSVYVNCNFDTIQIPVEIQLDSDLIPRSGNILQAFIYDIGKEGILTLQEADLVFAWLIDPWKDLIPADSLIFVRKANYTFTQHNIRDISLEFGNFTLNDRHVIVEKASNFYLHPIPFNLESTPYVFSHYSVTTGSSGILGWLMVETSPDLIEVKRE